MGAARPLLFGRSLGVLGFGDGPLEAAPIHWAQAGSIADSRLFFFHRQASDEHKLDTPAGIRAAVIEASGPVAEWSDIDGICEQWRDPTADRTYLERVWLNRLVRASEKAFDVEQWKSLADPDYIPADRAMITIGFDGARWLDSTALVGTEISTGFQWLLGLWEKPEEVQEEKWEVPQAEVDNVVAEAFRRWNVWRMYADPPYWETVVAGWAGTYGEERVIEWWTNRWKLMAYAIKSFNSAISAGDILHDSNSHLTRHLGNAVKKVLALLDDEGKPLWTIYKERPDSPFKIDAAMAAILSWEARTDALTAGIGQRQVSVYESHGLTAVGRGRKVLA